MCVPFYDTHQPDEIVRNAGMVSLAGSPSITRNSQGYAGDSVDATGAWEVWATTEAAAWLPTLAATVVVIRRLKDTTLRQSSLFGLDLLDATPWATRLGAHVPYSDGTVYWDFGGASGANRLTWAGYTKSAAVDYWVFTAGPAGMAIYYNGVQVAVSTTAVTRSVATSNFWINNGNGSSGLFDSQEVNLFLILPVQWGQAQVSEWTARPYSIFLPQAPRVRTFQPAVGVAAVAPPSLTLVGVGR